MSTKFKHLAYEADIGSGERDAAQIETDSMIEKLGEELAAGRDEGENMQLNQGKSQQHKPEAGRTA